MTERVFGIGLNKTGTTTLGQACAAMGYDAFPFDQPTAMAYLDGDRAPMEAALATHTAFEDWPWPLCFRSLLRRFGASARYVLTVRQSPEVWLESIRKHAMRGKAPGHLRRRVYGFAWIEGAEAAYTALYLRHIEEVQGFFAREGASDLLATLCWETGDGWEALAALTGRPCPGRPFPHSNPASPAPPDILARNTERAEAQRRELAGLSHRELMRRALSGGLAKAWVDG